MFLSGTLNSVMVCTYILLIPHYPAITNCSNFNSSNSFPVQLLLLGFITTLLWDRKKLKVRYKESLVKIRADLWDTNKKFPTYKNVRVCFLFLGGFD